MIFTLQIELTMKKYVMNVITALLVVGLLPLCGCVQQGDGERKAAVQETTQPAEKPVQEVKTSIEGAINHDNWDASQSSTVTFERFPGSLAEWERMREVLGTEPQGAVALQVMAFELYHSNKAEGTQAIEKNNTATNCTSTLRQLEQVLHAKEGDYARPYLPLALLQGATPENGYRPHTPYQVLVRVNPAMKYQHSEMLGGTVIYLQVDGRGWDTNWRGVEVVKPQGEQYYVVSNCPAMYTQCKKTQLPN
ncbi:MAG: hypothetical protein IKR71_08205 [Bacteroidales bacterium]|nr:hypothetical protein [Bacteroidales bacterium]